MSAAPVSHREVANRGLLVVSVMLATLMQALDTTIANVALPNMQGSLAATQDQIAWVLTSYIVASAIMTPATGWLADRLGLKRLFLASVLGFTLASMLCGLATSLGQMVVFRVLQGIFGAALVPLSQTLLLANYPPKRRTIALALWAMMVVVAPIFGPILGGWITDNYAWPWIFFINVPVGIFTLFVVFGLLRDRETRTVKVPVDAMGLGLLAVGVGSLQFMLDTGNEKDWFSSHLITTLGVVDVLRSRPEESA